MIGNVLGNVVEPYSYVKTDVASFLATFGNIWATFYLNIWSHWRQTDQRGKNWISRSPIYEKHKTFSSLLWKKVFLQKVIFGSLHRCFAFVSSSLSLSLSLTLSLSLCLSLCLYDIKCISVHVYVYTQLRMCVFLCLCVYLCPYISFFGSQFNLPK